MDVDDFRDEAREIIDLSVEALGGLNFEQKDKASREPAPTVAAAVMEAAKDRGLIIGKGGLYGNVLRISPALNVTTQDADQAADILDQALLEGGKA